MGEVLIAIDAPDWALEGGFPEDTPIIERADIPVGSMLAESYIYRADNTDGPFDIYTLPNGTNVSVLSETSIKKG